MIRSHLGELMRRHQLKTTELARLANVNRSTVAALTRDRATRVDLTALERICTVLGCGLGDCWKSSRTSLGKTTTRRLRERPKCP